MTTKARDCYENKQTVVSFLEAISPTEDLNNETENLLKPSVLYRSLSYQTLESWSRFRRVVSKVEFVNGVNVRFVVTSLATTKVPQVSFYTQSTVPEVDV